MRRNNLLERKAHLQGKELLLDELAVELLTTPLDERVIHLEDLRFLANQYKVLKQFTERWDMFSQAFEDLWAEASRPKKQHFKSHLKLQLNSRNNVANTLTNYIIILLNDRNIKGKIIWDEYFQEYQLSPAVPRLNNSFDIEDQERLTQYIKDRYSLTSKEKLHTAMEIAIKSHDVFLPFMECCLEVLYR